MHGHHYALVVVDGLEPGTIAPYTVELDGERVWPPAEGAEGADFPPSVLTTLKPGKPLRMAFGSCRTSVGHDEAGNTTHGVDALRSLALKMATDRDAPLAGPRAVPRRPGVRRRDHRGDAGVHQGAARHRGAAGQGAQGLRGVLPPLRAGLERPAEPVAALHAAELDDLRRPRRPRRLEHLLRVEAGDREDVLVARADRVRAGVLLGAPAPREPLARRAGGRRHLAAGGAATRATTSSTSPRRCATSPSASTSTRRPTAGATPARSPATGSSSSTRGRPACSSPTGATCSTTTSWPGSTSRCAAT